MANLPGMEPIARFAIVALDAREPRKLAEFYGDLLGWEIDPDHTDDTWVQLRSSEGATLAFQHAPDHVAPDWPSDTDHLQAHLDLFVDDLDEAEPRAIAVGARKTDFQPSSDSFRVYVDPAGHPFCLCLGGAYS